ncbi:MAG TPA: phage portal protein [Rhodanobacter sp.]|nr:phage portal protein [Rhodanobacter sp.]
MSESTRTAMTPAGTTPQAHAFSFGDPSPVLDGREMLDYIQAWRNGKWYEPPVSLDGLAKSFRSTPHHSSAIYVKCNILTSTFRPHKLLSRETFGAWALDFLVFGNGYLETPKNRLGQPMPLKHAMAKYMRRGCDDLDTFFFVQGWKTDHEFEKGSMFQLRQPDVHQEIYGLPEYLSALQSAWLNEAGTLFRRKYYLNGSHAGYILHLTDALTDEAQVEDLKKALKDSKGPGNFRNLFLYAPGGKKDGIQMIPISEVAAKDEFFNIKNVTRDDILAAHRVPPQLLGLVPTGTTGFGSVIPAAQVFAINELLPLQARFQQFNEWIGQEVVAFDDYKVTGLAPNGTAAIG